MRAVRREHARETELLTWNCYNDVPPQIRHEDTGSKVAKAAALRRWAHSETPALVPFSLIVMIRHLPGTRTASYLDEAEGAYVGSDGDAGVWWSRLKLDADFATSTISGCVGCLEADPMRDDRGIYTYTNVDDLKNDRWTEEDYYLSLRGDNNINSDGTFEGTLKLMRLSTDSKLASNGKWGGLFSEDSNQAIGTLGETGDGAGFIGVFVGQ